MSIIMDKHIATLQMFFSHYNYIYAILTHFSPMALFIGFAATKPLILYGFLVDGSSEKLIFCATSFLLQKNKDFNLLQTWVETF